jgi:recombinational DNA repair protein RecT
MDVEEINEVRSASESWKNEKTRAYSPWEKHYPEMARKTVIRRLYKYLPRTSRMDKVDQAIQVDDQQYRATFSQIMYIDDLLRASTISPERIQAIEGRLHDLSQIEAGDVISYLKENQEESQDPAKQFNNRAK